MTRPANAGRAFKHQRGFPASPNGAPTYPVAKVPNGEFVVQAVAAHPTPVVVDHTICV